MTAKDVIAQLQKYADAERAVHSLRFFKTGKGQYGEGDQFIGITVPQLRLVCKANKELPLAEVQKLLDSPVHEHRLGGAIILANKYPKSSKTERQAIYDLYLKNVKAGQINNWDIVDTTAPLVMGRHIWDQKMPRNILFELAKSDNLWRRRVGIMSSFYFTVNGDPSTTLQLCELLVGDKHDLIQKAVGWMLREIGKRGGRQLQLKFLDKHAATMPRTALRYAIEHLSPEQKTHYMGKKAQKN